MTTWLTDLDPALRWLLVTSLQASILVVLVLGIQAALGRWLNPRIRYALWAIVVLRLLIPVVPASSWSVFNLFNDPPAPT